MKRIFAIIAACTAVWIASASGITSEMVEESLRDLDREAERLDGYKKLRVERIDSLKHLRAAYPQGSQPWLKGTMEIAKSYNAFNNDSALYYYTIGVEQAAAEGQWQMEEEFRMRRATYLTISGYIHDALADIAQVDTAALSPELRSTYFAATRQMYSYISTYYDGRNAMFDRWHKLAVEAQRRLLPTLNPASNTHRLNLGEYYFSIHEYANAERELTALISAINSDNPSYAVACHILSQIAAAKGDINGRLYYLAQSAISDIRNATLEVTSIQELGGLLYERSDVGRAHRYLNIAITNAVESRASVRMSQTTELLNVVESHHNRETAMWRKLLIIIIIFLAVCLGALAFTIWHLRRQLHHVAAMRQTLQTANRAKDVYISQFLNLSSIFMDKLKEFSKLANRKISAGQTDELYRITKSGRFVEEQSKEFYSVFDDAFLHIYPDFVERVNALLRPDEQIVLAEGELLNSDLRILAFMRLGIDDTNRVAHTLNYSVNTIYAYRNKLRNRAINRDTFEADIMAIGGAEQS